MTGVGEKDMMHICSLNMKGDIEPVWTKLLVEPKTSPDSHMWNQKHVKTWTKICLNQALRKPKNNQKQPKTGETKTCLNRNLGKPKTLVRAKSWKILLKVKSCLNQTMEKSEPYLNQTLGIPKTCVNQALGKQKTKLWENQKQPNCWKDKNLSKPNYGKTKNLSEPSSTCINPNLGKQKTGLNKNLWKPKTTKVWGKPKTLLKANMLKAKFWENQKHE